MTQPAPAPSRLEDATEAAPDGFEMHEVSEYREGAANVVRVEYLGPGVRNEITYSTFGDTRAAANYMRSLDPDACTVRFRSICADRVVATVVTGASSSTCPHPTEDVRDRALKLLTFGRSMLAQGPPEA